MQNGNPVAKQPLPTVAQMWEQYRAACYSSNPLLPYQEEHVKRAFYTASLGILEMVERVGSREDVKHVDAMYREAIAWAEQFRLNLARNLGRKQ